MFYQKNINISHPKEVYNFILNHYTYWMNNSGSGKLTIANNVKIYNLDLKCSREKALDIAFNDIEYADIANEKIDAFTLRHNFEYAVYFNGRSYGYICLQKQNNYSSSSSVLPEYIYNGYDYNTFKSKYNINREYEDVLRPLYEVIRDFDKLCDELQRVLEERVFEEEAKEKKYFKVKYAVIHTSTNPLEYVANSKTHMMLEDINEALEIYDMTDPFGKDNDEVRLVCFKYGAEGDLEVSILCYKGGMKTNSILNRTFLEED